MRIKQNKHSFSTFNPSISKKHDTILPSHGEQLLFATAAGPDAWKTARPDCENQRTSQQKTHRSSPVVMYVLIRTQRATNNIFLWQWTSYYPCTKWMPQFVFAGQGLYEGTKSNHGNVWTLSYSEAELFIFMRIPDWPCFIPSLTMHNLQTHPSTFLVVASLYLALPSMLFFKYQLYTTCSLYEWKQTWHLQIKKNFFQVWLS